MARLPCPPSPWCAAVGCAREKQQQRACVGTTPVASVRATAAPALPHPRPTCPTHAPELHAAPHAGLAGRLRPQATGAHISSPARSQPPRPPHTLCGAQATRKVPTWQHGGARGGDCGHRGLCGRAGTAAWLKRNCGLPPCPGAARTLVFVPIFDLCAVQRGQSAPGLKAAQICCYSRDPASLQTTVWLFRLVLGAWCSRPQFLCCVPAIVHSNGAGRAARSGTRDPHTHSQGARMHGGGQTLPWAPASDAIASCLFGRASQAHHKRPDTVSAHPRTHTHSTARQPPSRDGALRLWHQLWCSLVERDCTSHT